MMVLTGPNKWIKNGAISMPEPKPAKPRINPAISATGAAHSSSTQGIRRCAWEDSAEAGDQSDRVDLGEKCFGGQVAVQAALGHFLTISVKKQQSRRTEYAICLFQCSTIDVAGVGHVNL